MGLGNRNFSLYSLVWLLQLALCGYYIPQENSFQNTLHWTGLSCSSLCSSTTSRTVSSSKTMDFGFCLFCFLPFHFCFRSPHQHLEQKNYLVNGGKMNGIFNNSKLCAELCKGSKMFPYAPQDCYSLVGETDMTCIYVKSNPSYTHPSSLCLHDILPRILLFHQFW